MVALVSRPPQETPNRAAYIRRGSAEPYRRIVVGDDTRSIARDLSITPDFDKALCSIWRAGASSASFNWAGIEAVTFADGATVSLLTAEQLTFAEPGSGWLAELLHVEGQSIVGRLAFARTGEDDPRMRYYFGRIDLSTGKATLLMPLERVYY